MIEALFPIIEQNLKKHQVEAFEVYFENKLKRNYISKDCHIESAEEVVQSGIGIRVFKDQRYSFVYSTDLKKEGIDRLCDSALDILPLVDPDEDYGLPDKQEFLEGLDLKNYDPSLLDIPTEEKIKKAIALEKSAKSSDPKVKTVRSANYEEEILTRTLMNSEGLLCSHQKSGCALSVMAVAEENGEAQSAYEFAFSPFFEKLIPEKVGEAAARLAVSYLGGITPSSGKMPVIFDPLVSCEFLETLARSFNGGEVYKNRSFLKDKLGEKVYSEQLTIIDDRILEGGWSSSPFDGEGLPGRTLTLVEGGELKSYFLDSFYSRKLKLAGNGSSSRDGFKRPPAISYSNLMIPPGEVSDEDIFAEVGSGLWITEVIGVHAIDEISGDFSVGAQGFQIENGQIGGPVKKLAIAGNLHQIMKEVRWRGSNHRYYFNIGAPTLGFESISVSGT